MTGSARSLARRAGHALLVRRVAEAVAGAAAAGIAVGLPARLEGWASPGAAAGAAALAALLAFWAAARFGPHASAALNPESDEDALLRSALGPAADAEWRELLARSAALRKPAFLPVGEWIPATLLAAAAMFALAWQESRPRMDAQPLLPGSGIAASPADTASSAEADAQRRAEEQAERPAGDGEAGAAQGEWRALEPAAASGSILLPPGAAARERGAIERYLRRQASVDE